MRFFYPPRSTRLSRRAYLGFVAVTGGLALAQMLALPFFLDPVQFGLLALAISATQAVQQLGDLGFGNAAARLHIAGDERARFREFGVTICTTLSGLAIVLLIALGSFRAIDGQAAITLALAVVAGAVLVSSKMRSSARIQSGDERAATIENMAWQNSPKVGMIAASITGSAIGASIGSVVTAVLAGRPLLPRVWPTMRQIRLDARYWAPGLALVATAFAATWVDTYVVAAALGIASAGDYQAIVRPLVGVTYIYLPLISLIQSSANRGDIARVRVLTAGALGVTAAGAFIIGVILCVAGSYVWPEYDFPPAVVAVAGLSVVAACASAVFGTEMLVQGRQLRSALATLCGVIVLMASTLVLVPVLGLLGAAIGSAAGWGVAGFLQFFWRRGRDTVSSR